MQEALHAASSNEKWRAQALVRLVPRLGELGHGKEALHAASSIADKRWRVQALAGLVPHLSEPLLQEALHAASSIAYEHWRAKALAGLVSRLAELGHGEKALHAALSIADEGSRATALAGLASHLKRLPVAKLYALWRETLPLLATRTRAALLSDIQALIPVIEILGGKEAVVATPQAIIEMGRWFP